MNWPFVSRARLQQAAERNIELAKRLGAEQARADAAMEQVSWLRAQIEAQQQREVDERVRVASVPHPTLAPRAPDPVTEAIMLRSGNSRTLVTHLSNWAKQERVARRPVEDIVHDILNWRDADEEAA